LRKRIRVEVEDEEGTKFTLGGPVSREKLMKWFDMLEMMGVPMEQASRMQNHETFFGKMTTLLETEFAAGDFSSSDVARAFEEKYNQPVKLSTISTYLTRLVDREYIRRERFGNSWVYRRVYLKPSQVLER
jgi:Penicillinase repressor